MVVGSSGSESEVVNDVVLGFAREELELGGGGVEGVEIEASVVDEGSELFVCCETGIVGSVGDVGESWEFVGIFGDVFLLLGLRLGFVWLERIWSWRGRPGGR